MTDRFPVNIEVIRSAHADISEQVSQMVIAARTPPLPMFYGDDDIDHQPVTLKGGDIPRARPRRRSDRHEGAIDAHGHRNSGA
jgi:hypothetical protein